VPDIFFEIKANIGVDAPIMLKRFLNREGFISAAPILRAEYE
jgi:hypothetical protein